jgi:lysozyme
MHMTDRGLLALVRHEGLVPGPYLDVKQVWTFGIGHTAAAGPPDPATMPRGMPADLDTGIRAAFRVFRTDLAHYEAAVLRAVKVPLAPHEFDALVSFHYNTGSIAKAALTRHLNAGNRVAAADAFLNWRRPASIIPRREAERDLFRHGRYPVGTIPVWVCGPHGPRGLLPADPPSDRRRGSGNGSRAVADASRPQACTRHADRLARPAGRLLLHPDPEGLTLALHPPQLAHLVGGTSRHAHWHRLSRAARHRAAERAVSPRRAARRLG